MVDQTRFIYTNTKKYCKEINPDTEQGARQNEADTRHTYIHEDQPQTKNQGVYTQDNNESGAGGSE